MTLNQIKAIIGTMRPPFLLLTISIMTLTLSVAFYETHVLPLDLAILVFLGALAAHIAVNMLNEFEDDATGLDALTDKTPFSGGSGSLQTCPEAAPWVAKIAWGLIGFDMILGLYFLMIRGWEILPIGLLGLLTVVLYTSKITKMPWLCLIAPGLAFGPFMVLGGYFVLTGHFSILALGVSLVPFFLVNNLLLLNQYPDLEADRLIGRNNLLMRLGHITGLKILMVFEILAFMSLLGLVVFHFAPIHILLGLMPSILVLPMLLNAFKYVQMPAKMMPALGMNVAINILTPLLMALGFIWAL